MPEAIIMKSPLNEITAHNVNLAICYDFYNRHLLKGIVKIIVTYVNFSPSDPAYQGSVPNLDGGDGADDNILFGTNVDYEHPENDPKDPSS